MNSGRTKIIVYSIYLSFFLVLIRLFYWQVIKSDELKRQLILQLYKTDKIQAQNGNIFDSFGNQLTFNRPIYYLSLYKPNLKSLPDIIIKIKTVKTDLKTSDLSLLDKFLNLDSNKWITLSSDFSQQEKEKLNSLNLSFVSSTKLEHPYQNFAQHALAGLEQYYQKQLVGKAGFSWSSKNAVGQTILTNKIWTSPPNNGRNLYTTINPIVQNNVENILKQGVLKYSADKGSVVVMSSQTGAILAMADFSIASTSATLNPIIADLYEPGSIFKPLVMTMALNSQAVNSSFICTGCSQPRVIGPSTITNWDKSVHPDSSIYDIIKNSDNIGMSYIIDHLGLTNFLSYYRLLNLDRKTGIDLSGETKPILKNYWPDIDFATASFGQGFALTQIQMISAFNTLANNGYWVKPYLVNNKSTLPTKVFDLESTNKIKDILSYAVNNSPVANLKPPNLDVCAKSGTAQVAVNGGYATDNAIASYIGFSPCVNPKFTMLVTINNPKTSTWGSSTAAPIWFDIAASLPPLL